MTFASDVAGHVDNVFLSTSHFAVSVLRYAGGEKASASPATGVITWAATDAEHSQGRAQIRTGELLLSDSVTVTVQDAFLIEGNRTEVMSIDPIQDGARVVHVQQKIPETLGAKPIRTGGF